MKKLYVSVALNIILLVTGSFLVGKRYYFEASRKQAVHGYRTDYYKLKTQLFNSFRGDSTAVYMIGNSITELCPYTELFKGTRIENRGIVGDVTEGVLHRLHELAFAKPKKVFLEIGINDLSHSREAASLIDTYRKIVDSIHLLTPASNIYVESITPRNDDTSYRKLIPGINAQLEDLAKQRNCVYVDLYRTFADNKGALKPELTVDGLHFNGKGYQLFAKTISAYL